MPFSGFQDLDPVFAAALQQMIAANAGISVNSGYRTPERQAELYRQAVTKYGSEAEARKHVAPPGRSFHNQRLAADLAYADDATRQWALAHAGDFKLVFPMSYEPWHVEPIGARQGQGLRHVGGAGSGSANFDPGVLAEEPDSTLDLASVLAPAIGPPPKSTLLPDKGVDISTSLAGLGSKSSTGDTGGGAEGGGGDTASPDLETQTAGIKAETLGQPWETGALRTFRDPQDLADLFAVKKIGLADQIRRQAAALAATGGG